MMEYKIKIGNSKFFTIIILEFIMYAFKLVCMRKKYIEK